MKSQMSQIKTHVACMVTMKMMVDELYKIVNNYNKKKRKKKMYNFG